MTLKSPIILALDRTKIEEVEELIEETREFVSIFKFGLEFFAMHGPAAVNAIMKKHEIEVFLDLKLHDIPNTVAGASRSVSSIAPKFLTVHAAGGSAMINAAVKELPGTAITAVTLLTSLSPADLKEQGEVRSAEEIVLDLARLAERAGAKAIVSSPLEVALLKSEVPSLKRITPGIRSETSEKSDQSRTLTPKEAIKAGSNYLVIGRPITAAPDPGLAAARILEELA
jgi:orotidine-5'-phosphate decarboxylase